MTRPPGATAPGRGRETLGRRAAATSLIGAVVILGLKFGAYALTGSVGFLSDAAESLVNLVAAIVLMIALGVAGTPPDYRHPYGHTKAEYLSSVLEAALIMVAALAISVSAVQRLLHPQALQHVLLGSLVSVVAALVNTGLAVYLFRTARANRSAALEANARHLLTDVWTSVGVLVAVLLVRLTGFGPLDPIIALLVAANIVWVGIRVMRRSLSGLLDERLPDREEAELMRVLEQEAAVQGFHRLRTRRSGRARFAEVDIFVNPAMPVQEAHRLVARLEERMRGRLSDLVTTVHVEPVEEGKREGPRTPKEEFPDGGS